ncbi:hypothetical protein JHW43_005629 [Diplocarpon mali]|nr:hypothetical protein JHW43_005629 [Diplocarpon mali]
MCKSGCGVTSDVAAALPLPTVVAGPPRHDADAPRGRGHRAFVRPVSVPELMLLDRTHPPGTDWLAVSPTRGCRRRDPPAHRSRRLGPQRLLDRHLPSLSRPRPDHQAT